MMSDANRHPILFSAPLVRAILRGEKTETRRVCKGTNGTEEDARDHSKGWTLYGGEGVTPTLLGKCPYGAPGDMLMVREGFRLAKRLNDSSPSDAIESDGMAAPMWPQIKYEADGEVITEAKDWGRLRPSIHMPYDLCRLRLRVEEVRVERVQEISEEGIRAEGWSAMHDDLHQSERLTKKWCRMAKRMNPNAKTAGLRPGFATIWDEINADRGHAWESNPWVWVVRFSRAEDMEEA